jgi:NAD(P)-dependent dehydrogenase (short-subunit alcohol dehydrogenase family)
VEALGVKALAVQVDIRDEAQIAAAIQKTVDTFGGIDIVVNNASAIQLTDTANTPSKRFDLMHSINVRGTFLVVQHALPYLKKSSHAHILTLSPPINMDPKWFGPHVAYTISKYDMSMLAIGWAAEFKDDQIASNALWPRTTIDTSAVRNLLGGAMLANMSRTPAILADAAFYILSKEKLQYTGQTFIDEAVLAAEGIQDLSGYSVVPGATLYTDLFL